MATQIEVSTLSYPDVNTDDEDNFAPDAGQASISTMNTSRLEKEHQFGRKLKLAIAEGHFKSLYDPEDVCGSICTCKTRACPPFAYWVLTITINLLWAILGSGILGDWEYDTFCHDPLIDGPFVATCTRVDAGCWKIESGAWALTGEAVDACTGRWYDANSGPAMAASGNEWTDLTCAQDFSLPVQMPENAEAWTLTDCREVGGEFLRERTDTYTGPQFGTHKSNYLSVFKYSYVGFLISFLLVFRAQQAYAYYRKANEEWMKCQWNMWEAYQLMSAHIQNAALVQKAGQHLIAFSVMLKCLLRGDMQPLADAHDELKAILEPKDLRRIVRTVLRPERDLDADGKIKRTVLVKHGHCAACLYVCRRILEYGKTANAKAHKESDRTTNSFTLAGAHVWALRRLSRLNESLCTMHMISTSPFPWTYMLHVRFMVLLWIVLIPVEILKTCWTANGPKYEPYVVAILTFVFSTIISYAIMGLEQIGNELQNPFGNDVSDLPMETFCKQNHENLNSTANVVYKIYSSQFEDELDEIANRKPGVGPDVYPAEMSMLAARVVPYQVQEDSDDDGQ